MVLAAQPIEGIEAERGPLIFSMSPLAVAHRREYNRRVKEIVENSWMDGPKENDEKEVAGE